MTSAGTPIEDGSHVAAVRRVAERFVTRIEFGETRRGQVGLVVTELATNILKHARRGEILLTECRDGDHRGIEILSIDSGPGFDVESSMRDGQSTTGSLGQGLGAVQRISDEFSVFSQLSKGSVALSRIWSQPYGQAERRFFAVGAVNVPKPGEERCGDDWAADVGRNRAAIMVADGLGHGRRSVRARPAARANADVGRNASRVAPDARRRGCDCVDRVRKRHHDLRRRGEHHRRHRRR